MQGKNNAISRKIADVLQKDKRGFFYIIHTENDFLFSIDRGKEENFGSSKPNYGADYYATILGNFENGKYELAEHFVPCKESPGTQINIFGYFASPKVAAKNLLRLGNTSCDGRKPADIYR